MTFWIMFTMVVGTLCGGIAAALVGPKETVEVQADVAQPPVEADADADAASAPDDDPEKAEDTP
jgi:hypothetical protein